MWKYLNIALLLVTLENAVAQEPIEHAENRIDSLIQSTMDAYRIPGLAIGIVKDGNPFMSKGYGYTSCDSMYLTTDKTLFHAASITKVFTATAIMQLVEAGEIRLTDELVDHVPGFQMKDDRYQEITIEHLLTHSSGLPWEHDFKHSPDDSTALRAFVFSLKKEKLQFDPGEKFDGSTYSNVAYSMLGHLIEEKSGMGYDDYVRKHVLDPCAMTHSTLSHQTIAAERKAMPHILSGRSKEIERFNLYGEVKDENPVFKYPENAIVVHDGYGRTQEHAPNDGLITSAKESNQWMSHLLEVYQDSLGRFNGVVSHTTLQDMWSLKRSIPDTNTSLGICWWRSEDENFGEYVFHVGREPGFCSTLMVFPEQDFGITILCNVMYADQLVWNTLPFEIMGILDMEKQR